MYTLKRNLAYRFVLKDAVFSKEISIGKSIEVTINLENVGYSSPVKERDVKLILRNKTNASNTTFDLNTDVRLRFSETSLKETFNTSGVLAAGEYDVLLHITDTYKALKDRSEYSFRLVNQDVWKENTGYNNLNHTIVVN